MPTPRTLHGGRGGQWLILKMPLANIKAVKNAAESYFSTELCRYIIHTKNCQFSSKFYVRLVIILARLQSQFYVCPRPASRVLTKDGAHLMKKRNRACTVLPG
ncbi:hypothetical protein [Aquitalea sp. ASV15]|uniref:hypothetical protein n=1 Tax=Aquitalea sp. ASV15 TaxID=2795104 RepID=UPI0018EB4693|nr:hypothetical protein [Aquitalea sp. ASV15]